MKALQLYEIKGLLVEVVKSFRKETKVGSGKSDMFSLQEGGEVSNKDV